jgi:hypothetical protein
MMNFFPKSYFTPYTVDNNYVVENSDAPPRVYAQYRNKPKVTAWYNITRSLALKIGSASDAVRLMYDIDFAEGAQLDILGRIVVMPRNFLGIIPMSPGAFAEIENNPAEFGDSETMFSALTLDQDSNMSDELYRLAIKSKILKNNSYSTIEDILFGMNFLLPNAQVMRVTDGEDMSFSVEFYGNISEIQRWALLNASLVAKPQGVHFKGFLEAYDYVQSGDYSEQFGDVNTQFVGFVGV